MSEDQAEYKVERKVKPKPAKKKTQKKQKPAIPKKAHGRPSKYKPEYNKIVFEAARKGMNDEQIADLLSVTFQTLNNWKYAHDGFFESLQKGKDDHDMEIVESSLLKRVKGYEYQEIHSELDANGKPIPEKTRVVKKYMGPDTRAIMFWLINRNNKRWSANPSQQGEGAAKVISDFINAIRPKGNEENET
jgi:hypothetical protein